MNLQFGNHPAPKPSQKKTSSPLPTGWEARPTGNTRRVFRRQGLGREALAWLRTHAFRPAPRVRLDVLVNNLAANAFWRAAGFEDYCLTMEMPIQ